MQYFFTTMEVLEMDRKNTSNPCSFLRMDEACFKINNQQNIPVSLFYTLDECYMCDKLEWMNISAQNSSIFPVVTKYPFHIYTTNCNTSFKFEEHGKYEWNITEAGCSDISVLQTPTNIYIPILVAVAVYVAIAVIWSSSGAVVRYMRNYFVEAPEPSDIVRIQDSSSPTSSQSAIRTTKASTRIQSIDTFRGISILLMIFVNNGGGNYKIFNHTAWNGITIADLVLPWFAWIMGLTITISKRADLRVSNSRGKIIMRCLRRSLNLIFLGLILNSKPYGSLTELRFPSVLQLLAVGYFFCATLETVFIRPSIQFERTIFRDILNNWAQWLIMLSVVALHTGLTFFLPVPGCPKGYLGPGGSHLHGRHENCTAGAAGYIDRLIFRDHVYNKTHNPVYGPILPYDPEGLLNSMSSILIVYLGVHGGKILLCYYHCKARVTRWIAWSVFTGLVAGLLCDFKRESGLIPLNKNMMTLSFVLLASSSAFLIFALLYLVIDYKRIWSGKPFIFAGINPILLYVGHYITHGLFPWAWNISPSTSHQLPLTMDLWTTTLWALVAYRLYKKDIIFTV